MTTLHQWNKNGLEYRLVKDGPVCVIQQMGGKGGWRRIPESIPEHVITEFAECAFQLSFNKKQEHLFNGSIPTR